MELSGLESKDMEAEIAAQMEADRGDPTKQSYFLRMDCKRIVKTEAEHTRLSKAGVEMRLVSYKTALGFEEQREARVKAQKARMKKRKATKAARKIR